MMARAKRMTQLTIQIKVIPLSFSRSVSYKRLKLTVALRFYRVVEFSQL